MDTEIIAALVGIFGALVGAFSARRRHRATLRDIEARVDLLAGALGVADALRPQPSTTVETLVARGEKIQAIKAYREENPGVGLKEAKQRVDALGRPGGAHAPSGDPHRIVTTLDGVLRSLDIESATAAIAMPEAVAELVREGRKIEAIKTLRDHFPGMGLAEAKERVESIR